MTPLTEAQARDEICRVGRSLFERGYVHSTAGNISVALADGGWLITPTDACLGFLDPQALAHVNAAGEQVGGARASKTLALHRAIYAASAASGRPAGCVIHTHSTHCVALSLQRERDGRDELIDPIVPYAVMKVGRVPLAPYHRPGDPAVADWVAARIAAQAAAGRPIRAVMLARLGPNVWHDSPGAAMAVLEELEETARLMRLEPHTAPLDEAALDELRRHFGASW